MNRILESCLLGLGKFLYVLRLYRLVMWWNRRCPKVLLYHACEHHESEYTAGLGVNTPPELFAMHLAFLARHYEVVPLELLESGSAPHRAVVITFDDGYRSVFDQAFPLLRRHAMPAVVYLVTSVVGNEAFVWVNELNWLLRAVPEEARRTAYAAAQLPPTATSRLLIDRCRANYDAATVGALTDQLAATIVSSRRPQARDALLYLDWSQIEEMQEAGLRFGNHTHTHPSLPRIDDAGIRQELAEASSIITERLGSCRSFAFPFGDVDARTRAVAAEPNWASMMEVGGSNRRLNLRRVARVTVSARNEAELFAQLEIVPILGRIKRLIRR